MPLGRVLSLFVAAIAVIACSATKGQDQIVPPVVTAPKEAPQFCTHQGESSNPKTFVDAVYVQRGVLFGVDLQSGTVRELTPHKQPLDYVVNFALFSGDGHSLVIQRDWEGRDSWWAATADGSNLKRLPLPSLLIQQVLRLCASEFVGVLKDGRLVRFNLKGDHTFWAPTEEDTVSPQMSAVSSPKEDMIAYVGKSTVVVVAPKENGLALARHVQGQLIHGWIGDDVLVTGDTTTLYVTKLSTGQSRRLEYTSLFGRFPNIVTVSVHPRGQLLYVVNRSSIPNSFKHIVALNPNTLEPLSTLPQTVPPDVTGAPKFSPFARYEVWPVEPPKDRTYAASVKLIESDNGVVVHTTNEDMVSVPYAFHPGDAGFILTDLSRSGKRLVYQDGTGRRTDLATSAEGFPFNAFQWNPRLATLPEK